MAWTDEKIQKAEEEIAKRASTDDAFRARCVADGNAVVEEIAGEDLPEGMTIKFFDPGDSSHCTVLPRAVSASDELSDSDLEQVAGGDRNVTYNCSGAGVSTTNVNM